MREGTGGTTTHIPPMTSKDLRADVYFSPYPVPAAVFRRRDGQARLAAEAGGAGPAAGLNSSADRRPATTLHRV